MHRRRFLRRIGAAGGVAATTALAGCSSVGGEPGYDVGMVADGYRPAELTVAVGDTVVWENTSARTHTVTAYEGGIPEAADYFASGGFDDEKTARTAWHNDFAARWRAATALHTPSRSPAATTTSVSRTRQAGCTRPSSWRSDAPESTRTVPDETH